MLCYRRSKVYKSCESHMFSFIHLQELASLLNTSMSHTLGCGARNSLVTTSFGFIRHVGLKIQCVLKIGKW